METRVTIQNGAAQKIQFLVKKLGAQFAIITDGNLKKLGEEILAGMRREGLICHLVLIPAGETSKSLSFLEKLAAELVKAGLKRDACFIGVGGGVVGDVSGFLASIYMRGVALVLVPTTLLAMGDSCIGGKNGVNLGEGKNLLGTFYRPSKVVIDPLLLKSLPERELRAGMAEVVKHAVIADSAFFDFLRKNSAKILKREPLLLQKMVKKSVAIKQRIVAADEKESVKKARGKMSRMLLNYGHTVGHALERLSGYKMAHGEAVSIGMAAENRVAVGKKLLKDGEAAEIGELLAQFGLPVKIPVRFTAAEIKHALATDKKNIGGKLYFALPTKIGRAKIVAL